MSRIFGFVLLWLLTFGVWQRVPGPGGRIPVSSYTQMVTSFTPGSPVNSGTGNNGYQFTAAAGVTVQQLCRWNISGNSGTHTVSLYDHTTSTLLASASVNTSLGTPGTMQCVSITPTALTSGDTIYVLSCEANGGDMWYHGATAFTFNSAFGTSVTSTYDANGAACTYGQVAYQSGYAFVPPGITK
jgi:hypothetical protein